MKVEDIPAVVHCYKCGGSIPIEGERRAQLEADEITLAQLVAAAAHERCPGEEEPPPARRVRVEVLITEPSAACGACGGAGVVSKWEGCGCGPGAKHLVDCGTRPPMVECPECRGVDTSRLGWFAVEGEGAEPAKVLSALAPRVQEKWQAVMDGLEAFGG